MTTQYPIPEQPFDAKPEKKRRWTKPLAYGGTALLGILVGASAAGASSETVEPAEPEVITETITETVEVEVVPTVCLDAINSARAGFTVAVGIVEVLFPAIEAAASWNVAGLEAAVVELEALNAELNQITFATEAAACEAAA